LQRRSDGDVIGDDLLLLGEDGRRYPNVAEPDGNDPRQGLGDGRYQRRCDQRRRRRLHVVEVDVERFQIG